MHLSISQPLHSLVEAKFKTASAAKSLIFSATEVCVIRTTAGIPFQLRYCPSLAKKPTPANDDAQKRVKKIDPFENPPPELWIADIPTSTDPSHFLVLNKFPIIKDHLILATKENKQQTHLLEEVDVDATYSCLKEWEKPGTAGGEGGGRLFAFFNSGEHSGASQPHRHLQFLPADSMLKGVEGQGWELLIDAVEKSCHAAYSGPSGFISHPHLPFVHFASRVPANASANELYAIYTSLHAAAVTYVRDYVRHHSVDLALHSDTEGGSPISYNMAMTTTMMLICPRRSGGNVLKQPDGTEVGNVELNGTVLGGTLMVKAEDQWELLKEEPNALTELLGAIGIPREKSEGASQL
ncbi:Ap4A phosphorylase-like protein II [Saccharata proteae CBS 121410]|uniref:Ap4A phosphorylase-like protein II n=1 Tax=Saccharata proteae CBS 121410 TaxID=1314787 RepID=A0A6A5YBJ4_9PEZI|nr:Ap4A phosphorylase-like protein II [Saccharata proteae CBS 121410]